MIVFTETWLNDYTADAELGLSNYTVYKKNRCSITSSHTRGGEALIAVRSDIASSICFVHNNSTEQLFVKLSLSNKSIIVGTAYISPEQLYDTTSLLDHAMTVELLMNNNPNSSFALFGDYNLNNINWSNGSPINFTAMWQV